MKANVEINGKSITINLTADQITEITKQTCRLQKSEDIQHYQDACEVLGRTLKCRNNYETDSEWDTHQLYTIIEAANYLDNDHKKYVANFDDKNVSKYIPYFEKKCSRWVLCGVTDFSYSSHCPVALYYKQKKTANLFAERFIDLYNRYLG